MFIWKYVHEIVRMKEIGEEENKGNVVVTMNQIEVTEGRRLPPPSHPFLLWLMFEVKETRQKYFGSPLCFCLFIMFFPFRSSDVELVHSLRFQRERLTCMFNGKSSA